MTTAMRYLLIGYALGIVTLSLLSPGWGLWVAFVTGEACVLLILFLGFVADWIEQHISPKQ